MGNKGDGEKKRSIKSGFIDWERKGYKSENERKKKRVWGEIKREDSGSLRRRIKKGKKYKWE